MAIKTIPFQEDIYPFFQAEHNAAQYAMPFAKKVCKGFGLDIGAGKREWMFPGAIPIDPAIDLTQKEKLALIEQGFLHKAGENFNFDANCLPNIPLDFIFSSHTLEHVPNWYETLKYWTGFIKPGGVLFLYLPDYSQKYWRPWYNHKHKNIMVPEHIEDALKHLGYFNIFRSGIDLLNSFMIMAEKD